MPSNDGVLLFTIDDWKMKPVEQGGSKIAILSMVSLQWRL
jgi:hypothetical protein